MEVVTFAFACLATSSLSLLLRSFQGGEDFELQVLARQNYFLTRVLGVVDGQGFVGNVRRWTKLTATQKMGPIGKFQTAQYVRNKIFTIDYEIPYNVNQSLVTCLRYLRMISTN